MDPQDQNLEQSPEKSQGVVEWMWNRAMKVLDDKNLIKYDFSFASAPSNLSESDMELIEKYSKNRVKIRLYCIRHGMTEEEKRYRQLSQAQKEKESFLQEDYAELCPEANEQYVEIAKQLLELWINNDNTYLFCCSETKDDSIVRVRDSAGILIKNIGLDQVVNNYTGLDTTDKGDRTMSRRTALTETYTADFMSQLQEQLRRNTLENINIICVIHKSNIDGIRKTFFGHTRSHLPAPHEIETGEIVTIDIDERGNAINYEEQRWILRLDDINYENIVHALIHKEPLNRVFEAFRKWKLQAWEVQNYMNAYFRKNEELYAEYLPSSNKDLRVFCLANLLENKQFTFIFNHYKKTPIISKEELNIIILAYKNENQWMEIFKILNIIFALTSNKEPAWKYIKTLPESLNSFGSNSDIRNVCDILAQNRDTYWKAFEIETRSLDESIKTWMNGAIIPQKLLLKKKDGDLDIDLDAIIQSEDSYILSAMVGSGKSLWTTSLVKKIISEYPEKQVIFFEGSDWNKYDAQKINKELATKIHDRKNTILVIDAFDEIWSDIDLKKETLEMLKRDWGDIKIVITGRQSEFNEINNEPFKTLALEFDGNTFIKKKWGQNKAKILEIFNDKKLNNLSMNNPLLIFFVCELANNYTQYQQLGILSLHEILIKTQNDIHSLRPILYENIIKLMIVKHKWIEPNSKSLAEFNDFFDEIFGHLSALAIGLSCNKNYSEIIKENRWSKLTQSRLFNDISILLKKGENNNYKFAHKSLQEYFVYLHRETFFKWYTQEEGLEKWYEFLQKQIENWKNGRGNNIATILTSIGFTNFKVLKQDIIYIVDQGGEWVWFKAIIKSIWEIDNRDADILLDQIIFRDIFKENPKAIQDFCGAICNLQDGRWYSLLESLVSLPGFKNNTKAINMVCFTLFHIQRSPRASFQASFLSEYWVLEYLITLPAFKENSKAIEYFCRTIGMPESTNNRHKLLELVVDLPAFKENPKAIEAFCNCINWRWVEKWYLFLNQIEELIVSIPNVFYSCALVYLQSKVIGKSIFYLKKYLEYQFQEGYENWISSLKNINTNRDWDNMREIPDFQTLITQYRTLLENHWKTS